MGLGAGKRGLEYAGGVAAVAVTAALGLALRARLQTTDIAMLLLLAVVFVASRWRRGPALVATVLAIAVFDFGFVPPYYTFSVTDKAYFLTFAVMFVVAFIMGSLTGRIRSQAEAAIEGERRATAAHALATELAEVPARAEQLEVITRHLAAALGGDQGIAVIEDRGAPGQGPRWPNDGLFEHVAVRVAALWSWQQGRASGPGTGQCAEAEACVVPLRSATRTIGVAVIRPAPVGRIPDAGAWQTAIALSDQASLALERAELAERDEAGRIAVESERLRTALLSSLSHDLRTPLGTIEGAASGLLLDSGILPAGARMELAETIVHESRRMTRLVANLLEMVRVESGGLAVGKSWQPLEEALGVALLRLDEQLKGHPVATHLPGDLPLVPIDELLIEQVFLNLLENALKYTPPGTPIDVSAWAANGSVVVEVADRGPGIPPGEERNVFRKFHRAPRPPGDGPVGGAGLGLTISEAIVTAHGGTMWVQQGERGGAAFRFTLPLDGPPLGTALTDVGGE